jgi:hypothetical protein
LYKAHWRVKYHLFFKSHINDKSSIVLDKIDTNLQKKADILTEMDGTSEVCRDALSPMWRVII